MGIPLARHRFVTLLAILALALTACGGGGGSSAEPEESDAPASQAPASEAAEEPNELLVLEWAGYDAPEYWTEFAEANPDTEVTFEFGDTDATILNMMELGSEADVFHFYTGWQEFYVDQGWSGRSTPAS